MSLEGLKHRYAVYSERGDSESANLIANRMKEEHNFDVSEKPKKEKKNG